MARYEMTGGDHGNYTIFPEGKTSHSAVAFLRRNQKGGGYTLSHTDGRAVYVPHMPTWEQANNLMMPTWDQANRLMETLEAHGTWPHIGKAPA